MSWSIHPCLSLTSSFLPFPQVWGSFSGHVGCLRPGLAETGANSRQGDGLLGVRARGSLLHFRRPQLRDHCRMPLPAEIGCRRSGWVWGRVKGNCVGGGRAVASLISIDMVWSPLAVDRKLTCSFVGVEMVEMNSEPRLERKEEMWFLRRSPQIWARLGFWQPARPSSITSCSTQAKSSLLV